MAQITYTQLAVILCAFCFITQVLSQSTVIPNSTLPGNQTINPNITVTSGASGGPANATTSPTGTGVQSQANTLCVLIAVAMTTGLQQHCC